MNVRGNDTAQTPSEESEALFLLMLLLEKKLPPETRAYTLPITLTKHTKQ